MCSHPQLRKEIEDRTSVIHDLEEPDTHDITMEDDCPDNLDILSSLIIQEVLSINISATGSNANMTKIHVFSARVDESSGLVTAMEEDKVLPSLGLGIFDKMDITQGGLL